MRRSVFIMLFFSVYVGVWLLSEVILYKRVRKSEKDDSIWLVLNILVPYMACVIYLLTHRVEKNS